MACAAPAATAGLITTIIGNTDYVGCSYVATAYQSLATSMTTGGQTSVAGLLLTLYVIFWGFGIWQGTATGSPTDSAFRLFRAFLIYAMATTWADFQILAYTVLNDGPSAIGSAMLASGGMNATGTAGNLTSASGVQTALQNIWDTTNAAVLAFNATAGPLSWGPYFYGAIILVAVGILVGFALFLIILAKIFMWLLLAIAPVFILLLLFEVTSRFFSGWVSALATYAISQILIYSFLAFYVSMTQSFYDKINGVTAVTWGMLAPIVVVSIIGILLLAQINSVAASIAGGIAIASPTLGRAFRAAGNAVMNARNPLSRTSTSLSERLAGDKRARVGVRSSATNNLMAMRDQQRLANQKRVASQP